MDTNKQVIVVDKSVSAEHPHREHIVSVRGVDVGVKFELGKATVVSYEVAMKFQQEGFDIIDPDSNEILEVPAETSVNIRSLIGDDECVAKYPELTTESLMVRCAQKQGGEHFIGSDDREGMLRFIRTGAADIQEEESLIEDEEDVDALTSHNPDPAPATEPAAEPAPQENPAPSIEELTAAFVAKYGNDFDGLMKDLKAKFGATDYTSYPDSNVFKMVNGDQEIIEGTLDDLIAYEMPKTVADNALTPDEPKIIEEKNEE